MKASRVVPSNGLLLPPIPTSKRNMGMESSASVSSVVLSPQADPQLHSILASAAGEKWTGRKDRNGTAISHGSKSHHIRFRDEAGGMRVADVKEVESYKDFNRFAEEVPATASCTCVLM